VSFDPNADGFEQRKSQEDDTMSRINTNVPSLIAQRVLGKNNNQLNTSLERLSTGLKINRGSDNPSGLIASENLRAEKTGIQAAITNAERASNIIGTAEGGLSEISSLLNELQTLTGEAANTGGLSSDEIQANQLQVDSILQTINRLAGSTSFQGTKLLDGSLAYTTSTTGGSVTAGSAVTNLQVNGARLTDNATRSVNVVLTTSAQTAGLAFTAATVTTATTIEITGVNGTEQLSFGSGTTVASIATAINAVSEATGVSAIASTGSLSINSTGFGSSQFVTIREVSGTFVDGTDKGTDAVVSVNGQAAETDGLNVKVRTGSLDIEFDLTEDLNTNGTDVTLGVTGGGANFALGGKVTESNKASLGIAAVTTGNLGKASIGFLSSLASGQDNDLTSGNLTTSQKIIDESIKQVATLRGRLGAFQKFTVGSTVNALGVALENVSASESAIRDTDFAAETSKLTRAQILSQAASSILAQANAAPQAALQLLR